MNKATILVIEDNDEVRENLVEILELHGYTVMARPDGIAGVKQAIDTPPDLILCDVMMPELDGYGVLNILGQNERTASVPFVFITAKTETSDIRRGMNLGADDYITKPFYKDELLGVIETRLRKAMHRVPPPSDADPSPHLHNPDRGISKLKEHFTEVGWTKVYSQGDTIVREGEYPHFVYLVKRGQTHLTRLHEYGRQYIIATVGPEEIFGVPSTLENAPFHYTATVASDELDCQLLPRLKLLELINRDRTVTEALMHLLAGRVVERSERLVNQAYDSVRRRTALMLCDLVAKYGSSELDLSRDELAQMVGSTKESVIRALSDFKKEGILTTSGRTVEVAEPERLRELLL